MKRWRTDGAAGRYLVVAALALLFLGGSPHQLRGEPKAPDAPTFSRAALDRMGDYVRSEITTGKIPGAVMLIQQHGKLVHLECFWVRDPATGQPMTPDTIFQIYSMSKAITSVAAMMLVDDGKLSLDDPVSKYIHSFADAKVGVDPSDEAGKHPLKLEPLKRPITIRDLLRHTSGITYGFFGEAAVTKLYANPQLYAGDFDNAEFADRIATLPLADQPATRWNYSHSTDVLGRVVEVASGQPLFQFEKQRLFDPLGMSETAYYVADEAKCDPFYFPGPTSGFGLGFAVRTSPPPNTTWPLGEYRWDGAGGSFYFVDPQDDMFAICMLQAPTQGGRIQLTVKTMMFEALGKGVRKD